MLDIRSIGVGGGSIASVDDSGILRVGPRSAGAVPGPACYDLGGDEPTITDAALVLGLLNAERFLAGRQRLNVERACKAVERAVAAPLGVTLTDAAYAIYQVAAAMMIDAIYLLTVRRGYDPRDFGLMLYGGASPLFAGPIASGLGVRTLVIPAHSSVFSARGMLDAELRFDVLRSVLRRLDELDNVELAEMVEELKDRGRQELSRMGVRAEDQRFDVSCDIRYTDQHHEIQVPLVREGVGPDSLPSLLATFHQLHEHLYGYSEPEREGMLVNIRMAATEVARLDSPQLRQSWPFKRAAVRREERAARWEESRGFAPTPIYDSDGLQPGDLVHGPAIIEMAFTTVVVSSGAQAYFDPEYNIIVGRGETPGS
jgi:N-methylhydantoinase A